MAFSFLLCLQKKCSKSGKTIRKMIKRRGETQICNNPANGPCISKGSQLGGDRRHQY